MILRKPYDSLRNLICGKKLRRNTAFRTLGRRHQFPTEDSTSLRAGKVGWLLLSGCSACRQKAGFRRGAGAVRRFRRRTLQRGRRRGLAAEVGSLLHQAVGRVISHTTTAGCFPRSTTVVIVETTPRTRNFDSPSDQVIPENEPWRERSTERVTTQIQSLWLPAIQAQLVLNRQNAVQRVFLNHCWYSGDLAKLQHVFRIRREGRT